MLRGPVIDLRARRSVFVVNAALITQCLWLRQLRLLQMWLLCGVVKGRRYVAVWWMWERRLLFLVG
jgi:hypothetical protein